MTIYNEAWAHRHQGNYWENSERRKVREITKIPSVSEHKEQTALFYWASVMTHKYPELKLLHAIPNGGLRDKAVAGKLKAEGVKPGVPDVCLPVARGGFHGLYIEMKRVDEGKTSDEQGWWLAELVKQGYYTWVCHGAVEAIEVIENYLGGGK